MDDSKKEIAPTGATSDTNRWNTPWLALGVALGAALGVAGGGLAWGIGTGAAIGLGLRQAYGDSDGGWLP